MPELMDAALHTGPIVTCRGKDLWGLFDSVRVIEIYPFLNDLKQVHLIILLLFMALRSRPYRKTREDRGLRHLLFFPSE